MGLLYGIPNGLLSAVCYVESAHNGQSIHYYDHGTHSYGLCQIKLETARNLGFRGSAKELMRNEVNAQYAGMYLQYQHARYSSWKKAIIAYNSGSTSGRPNCYFAKVKKAWREGK